MSRVLFVCLGNICRSPTAEGVFRALIEREGCGSEIVCDSAGTSNWHVGSPPDNRAVDAALKRGYDLTALRGRQVTALDFDRFDYVVAMDRRNHAALAQFCPPERKRNLSLMMSFAPDLGFDEVPDPYDGGSSGFERVIDMIEAAAGGLLDTIRRDKLG